jgi:glycine cleavage system aminomethyltransferase T
MDWTNNPFELGLDRLVDLDVEADFMGKAALHRIKKEGVRRRIVGVEIDGARLEMNSTRWPVRSNGDVIGTVTSAIYSPRLEKNIGYAWVPVERSDLGTALRVDTPDGDRRATVVRMPFVDPGKEIPKS